MEDIGDKVQCVDERAQVVIEGAWGVSNQPPIPSNIVIFRLQGSKSSSAGSKIDNSTDGKQDRRSRVFVTSYSLCCCLCLNLNILSGNQIKQLLRAWLSPADPSTNHNISRKTQYKGTALWFFQGNIFVEWKSTGSLLWVHGKRTFLSPFFEPAPSDGLRFW
jgi:hypothetical protein